LNQAMDSHEASTTLLKKVHMMFEGTPLFWGAVHLCVPNEPLYRVVTALFMAWIGAEGRKLMRIHRGNQIQIFYNLRSFGIPVGDIPQMQSGQVKTKNHLRLIKVRLAMDTYQDEQKRLSKRDSRRKTAPEAIKPFAGIECPEIDFVILSRLQGSQKNHPGNVAFRKIMLENEGLKTMLQVYQGQNAESITRVELMRVVDTVIYEACLHGLQFVAYDNEKCYYLEVISQQEIRKKVQKIIMRHQNKFRSKAQGRNTTPSPNSLDLSEKKAIECNKC